MLQDRVRVVMSQVFGIDKSTIKDDASQETLEKWDSLGHLNLCVALEEEFGVSLVDTQIVEMTSLKNVVQILSGMVRD